MQVQFNYTPFIFEIPSEVTAEVSQLFGATFRKIDLEEDAHAGNPFQFSSTHKTVIATQNSLVIFSNDEEQEKMDGTFTHLATIEGGWIFTDERKRDLYLLHPDNGHDTRFPVCDMIELLSCQTHQLVACFPLLHVMLVVTNKAIAIIPPADSVESFRVEQVYHLEERFNKTDTEYDIVQAWCKDGLVFFKLIAKQNNTTEKRYYYFDVQTKQIIRLGFTGELIESAKDLLLLDEQNMLSLVEHKDRRIQFKWTVPVGNSVHIDHSSKKYTTVISESPFWPREISILNKENEAKSIQLVSVARNIEILAARICGEVAVVLSNQNGYKFTAYFIPSGSELASIDLPPVDQIFDYRFFGRKILIHASLGYKSAYYSLSI